MKRVKPQNIHVDIKKIMYCHTIYHKFQDYIIKVFGKDLVKWQYMDIPTAGGKIKKLKYKDTNYVELSRRLTGYKNMERIERYIEKYVPEIKILKCDDFVYAGSTILLIPHPKHGITVFYLPQCTEVQNQFFLYENHCEMLIKELTKMKKVYKEK